MQTQQLSRFNWDLNPKRDALLEALKTCPGLEAKDVSNRLEQALEIFLKEYVKNIPQSKLEQFKFGADNSPRINETVMAMDLEKFSEEELEDLAEQCRRKADQFDGAIRSRRGIARRIKV